MDDFYAAMAPYSNGEAYQNYIDPYLPNWLPAYYGSNLPRLMDIKTAYDPDNFFSFPKSIPLNPPSPTTSTTGLSPTSITPRQSRRLWPPLVSPADASETSPAVGAPLGGIQPA